MENEMMNGPESFVEAPRQFMTRKTKRLIFYICMIALFIVETVVFYIYVNASSFILAFQKYENTIAGYMPHFVGFDNFKTIVEVLQAPSNAGMIKWSLTMYCVHVCVTMSTALFLSFYIYKKMLFAGFFRTILFLPAVISAVVMVCIYKYMVNDIYMVIFNKDVGLLKGDANTMMCAVIGYMLWMGYGTDILLYTGAMSGINESIVEASELDGCNSIQEFWFITLPCIFPTLITFIVSGLASVFTNQLQLYTFFGTGSPVQCVGYFMYVNNLNSPGLVQKAGVEFGGNHFLTYTELSAMGLMVTAVTLPVVLIVRYLLNKFGPRVD
ncbi:MAG: sugar ABC transporter permease [Clostridia bacterium]|nr:sugar ABC transporter permease [Clostridia bacterium]